MGKTFGGWPLVFLVAAVALMAVGQIPLGIASLLVWIMALAVRTMQITTQNRVADPREEMDAESRSLYAPVRRITAEIEELVQRNSDSAIMKVVGGEAVLEADRIRDQVARALAIRDDLKRALRERNVAKKDIEDLRAKAEASDSAAAKATLLSAMEARQMELEHYKVVEDAITRIDAGVNQAQAALSEMKARLAVKASSEKAASAPDEDDLRETIGRLRTLSISYDEAEQLLRH